MYDVVIIGGGPAGLTAGIYAARARLDCLLIDNYGINGQAVSTDIIENYPGFPDGIGGFQLVKNLKVQAEKFGLKIISQEVVFVNYAEKNIEIKTDGKIYSALSLIAASGAKPKDLGIPGEKELKGRGVSYCATCDAAFYKNKTVAVIGGGDTAIEEALFLTKFADKVLVIHRRDKLRATKILQERAFTAFTNKKINFIWNSRLVEIKGAQKVESIIAEDILTSVKTEINVDGVFMFVGYKPNTEYLKNILKLDENGYAITDDEMKTDRAGIFAAGDCRKKLLKQIITACSDGAIAAFSAEKYLDKLKGTEYNKQK
ncbi:MAG: thioredoxin-disulfide reductase [Elusimicrobia bacterium CG06_land_8_20_14_3_00_38_11]|nr:MAG: thioredoxin-disulfide reductase [Elusimicrobia bacterium CG06_land_8_20_14_3_00_38_11]